MKTLTAAQLAHITSGVTTFCFCVLVTRLDGVTIGFTSADLDLDLTARDGVVYESSSFTTSSIKAQEAKQVSEFDATGILDSARITEDDLIAGRYNGAKVRVFLQNWADLTEDPIILPGRELGQIVRRDIGFTAEVRGLSQALQSIIGSLTAQTCRANLGDTGTGPAGGCAFKIDPPAWAASHSYTQRPAHDERWGDVVKPSIENGWHFVCSQAGISGTVEPLWNITGVGAITIDGTTTQWKARRSSKRTAVVATVGDSSSFSVGSVLGDLTSGTGGSESGGFFVAGKVIFTSGLNVGIEREIVAFDLLATMPATYSVITYLPFPLAIAPGDELFLQLGCDKSRGVCVNNRDNLFGRRAEDNLPGQDALIRVIQSKGGGKK